MKPVEPERMLELADLASRGFPRQHVVTGDIDAWPFVADGLTSRIASTTRAIAHLHTLGQKSDATILLRSLFEHAVHFAWLAAQPDAVRVQQWRKDDIRQRLAADEDTRKIGIALLTDETRSEMQANKNSLAGDKIKLIEISGVADDFWSQIYPEVFQFGKRNSFRGFYALLYRHNSTLAHPTLQGLNPVTIGEIPDPRLIVKIEDSGSEGVDPYGWTSIILGMALFVSSKALGSPTEAEINEIFERFEARD